MNSDLNGGGSAGQRARGVVLSESLLDVRAGLLSIAATLDRIDRAGGDLPPDLLADRNRINEAIGILRSDHGDRAASLQQLFSLPYDPDWPATLDVAIGSVKRKRAVAAEKK